MPNKILDELIACGVSSDTILAIAELIAAAKITEDRRAKNRDRMRAVRTHPHTHAHTDAHEHTENRHIDKQASKEKRKKESIPPLWIPDEIDRQYAKSKGWADSKIDSEGERFRNNAEQNGRLAKNWHAAWRNWVTSPYQQPAKQGAFNGHDPSKSILAALDRLDQRLESQDDLLGGPDDLLGLPPR